MEIHPEPLTFWEQVPDELLHRIAMRLDDGVALTRLRRVSKRCRRIADSDDLWRELCVSKFNVAPDSQPPSSWAEVYRSVALKYCGSCSQGLRFDTGAARHCI